MASKSFTDQATLWASIFIQILPLLTSSERKAISVSLGSEKKPTKSNRKAMEKIVSNAVSRTPSQTRALEKAFS